LGNFHFDQAEGLRRMLGPKPRTRAPVFTFLSATPEEDKGAMLVNLGASLAQHGNGVLLVDACHSTRGIAAGLQGAASATVLHLARRECGIEEVIQRMPQGFGIAALLPASMHAVGSQAETIRGLPEAFDELVGYVDVVVVDAELGEDGSFPLACLATSEIVVQVSTDPQSITSAYSLIKRVSSHLGQRPFSVLVTGASDQEAQVVYQNMAQAAKRYLAVKLNSMGSVPADEYLTRAARLGRAVVEAFPLAGASVAFRRLAEKFALSEDAGGEPKALAPQHAELRV
jgi:flagellar biosynthesis protein FlhG